MNIPNAMKIKNSLVVPCYNEMANLKSQEETLLQIPTLINGELILVDNGSSDGTDAYIKELVSKNRNIILVTVKNNIGYGFGILSGLRVARGDYVGWTHADGQMNLRDSLTGFSMLCSKNNPEQYIVIGSRNGRSWVDLVFTVGMSVFESILFGTLLSDITAQPKMMTRTFFESWRNPPNDFSLDLFAYVQAKKHKKHVIKFDVIVNSRLHGVSTWNNGMISRIKLILRTVHYSLKLRFAS